MHVKKGDKVKVIAGNDRGRTGEITRALPREDKVIVDGINERKHHLKLRSQGQEGGIVEKPTPIHVSNVKKVEK